MAGHGSHRNLVYLVYFIAKNWHHQIRSYGKSRLLDTLNFLIRDSIQPYRHHLNHVIYVLWEELTPFHSFYGRTLGNNQLRKIPEVVGYMKNLQQLWVIINIKFSPWKGWFTEIPWVTIAFIPLNRDLSKNAIERISVRVLANLRQLKVL